MRNVLPVGRDAAGREGVIRAQIAVDHPPPLTQVEVQVWKQGGRRRSDKGVTQGGWWCNNGCCLTDNGRWCIHGGTERSDHSPSPASTLQPFPIASLSI